MGGLNGAEGLPKRLPMLLKAESTRWIIGLAAVGALGMMYLFQRFDFSMLMGVYSSNARFVMNKSFRFLVNDLSCLMLIAAVFNKSGYLRLSSLVFLVELVVLLPLYFVVKLSMEGDTEISSPLLSQWHRMIVNPLLMLVLMMGFVYQDFFWKKLKG